MVPAAFGSVPFAPNETKTAETDTLNSAVLGTQTTKDPSADQNAKTVAVAATESGWKFFGLAWYWWALLVGFVTFLFTRRRLRAQRIAADT
jgi:predicted benzoate:H+ symporter BenE